jgi:hypothetical protein
MIPKAAVVSSQVLDKLVIFDRTHKVKDRFLSLVSKGYEQVMTSASSMNNNQQQQKEKEKENGMLRPLLLLLVVSESGKKRTIEVGVILMILQKIAPIIEFMDKRRVEETQFWEDKTQCRVEKSRSGKYRYYSVGSIATNNNSSKVSPQEYKNRYLAVLEGTAEERFEKAEEWKARSTSSVADTKGQRRQQQQHQQHH